MRKVTDILVTIETLLELFGLNTFDIIHCKATAKYAHLIATKLGLPNELRKAIYIGGLLHDIGKVGVPTNIINKPSKLTNEEYEIVKQHPIIGYNMLKDNKTLYETGYREEILDIVLHHHERVDGKGYPKGLKGGDIPFYTKIITVADSFDAMTSHRVYRDSQGMEYAINEMIRNKGIQFESEIIDAFLQVIQRDEI